MPTQRDANFADLLLDIAIDLDALCERLDDAKDRRADSIIASLRDVEFECNELREKVSPQ